MEYLLIYIGLPHIWMSIAKECLWPIFQTYKCKRYFERVACKFREANLIMIINWQARHADFLKTRAFCDDQFKANMKKTCNHIQNPLIRGPCTMFAKLYFKAVHKLGLFFFEQKPPPYCSSTWVKKCVLK